MLRSFYRAARRVFEKVRNRDDFDWPRYTDLYAPALEEEAGRFTHVLQESEFMVEGGRIVLADGLPPLHPNHRLIYETVLRLRPASVMEVGFGGGYHLVNIGRLLPEATIYGCDLLPSQVELAVSKYPELNKRADLFIHDITTGPPPVQVDLVFTQTVVMHIKRNRRHLRALKNIIAASSKYVVLMENWSSHNFVADIRRISKAEDFGWPDLNMYFVDDDEQQIAMVLSNTPVGDLQPLHRNGELLKYL